MSASGIADANEQHYTAQMLSHLWQWLLLLLLLLLLHAYKAQIELARTEPFNF
jgi:hypothetical protein